MATKASRLKAMIDQVNPRELLFLDEISGLADDEMLVEYA